MAEEKYLFIEDLNLLKTKIEKFPNLYNRLIDQCKRYEDVILTDRHPKGSSSFMGMAAANLSLLSLLTGESRWIKEAKRWIFTALNYDHWGHTNLVFADINSSWMLFGLSLSFNWFKDFLTEDEISVYKKRLYTEGARKWSYKEKHQKSGWPINYWQNHNWLNFTGLATVSYALKDEYPEDSEKWLQGARSNFKKIFTLMPDDGTDYEGVVYWRYGIIWLIQYAHLIKTEEGVDLFKKNKFLKNTFYYRLYQCSPIFEKNYNFGDCHDTRSGHSSAVYFKLASEYDIQEAQWMGEHVTNNLLYKEAFESNVKPGILPEAFLELIWFDPKIKKRSPKNMPLTRYFPDLGLISCRSDWGPNAFAFSVKAGYPGGEKQWKKSWELQEREGFTRRSLCHQHSDDGSPIIWKGENNYIIDEGYNREVKVADHNMISFDGKGYKSEGRHNIFKKVDQSQYATMETFKEENNNTYAVANLKQVYDKSLGVLFYKRHFFYSGNNTLIMFDDFLNNRANVINWHIHSENEFNKLENGWFTSEDNKFFIRPICIDNFDVSKESKEIIAILNKQEPDRKTRRKMEKLSLNFENRKKRYRIGTIFDAEGLYKDSEIVPINSDLWSGFKIIKGNLKEYYLLSKLDTPKKDTLIPEVNIKTSSSFINILLDGNEIINLFSK